MKNKFKYLLLFVTILSFFALSLFISIPQFLNIEENLANLFYWLELLLIIELLVFFKLNASLLFYFSFILIAFGAIINVVDVGVEQEFFLDETLFRIAFVPLVVGTLKNMFEILRQRK